MSIAFFLLIALLAASLAVPIIDGAVVPHALYFVAALMLACAAAAATPSDIAAIASRLRRFALAMLFPIIWMMIQVAPFPLASLANPIWSATALALNEPSLPGRISIDAGSTLGSLMWYLAVLSVIVSTVLLTNDRRRAETILLVVTAVATFIALENLLSQVSPFAAIVPSMSAPQTHSFLMAAPIAALGNAAMITMAMERHARRANTELRSIAPLLLRLLPGIVGIVIALASLAVLGQRALLALTGLGFAVMVLVAIVRRLGFSPWPSTILAGILVALVGAAALSALRSGSSFDLLSAVQSSAPDSLAIAQRALSDASWLGGGVGTFSQIARVYLDYGASSVPIPPSTAVSVAIEWGRLALLILAMLALQLFFFALRGAVGRGRDSFFASATAAIVIIALGEAFMDPSMLNPAIQILLAGMVGLGISQSVGKTSSF